MKRFKRFITLLSTLLSILVFISTTVLKSGNNSYSPQLFMSTVNEVIKSVTITAVEYKYKLAKLKDKDRRKHSSTSSNNPKGKVIYVDPGHDGQHSGSREGDPMNGTTAGGMGVNGVAEYTNMLEIGLKLRDALEAEGYTVYMSRETNTGGHSKGNFPRGVESAGLNASMHICLHSNAEKGFMYITGGKCAFNDRLYNIYFNNMKKYVKVAPYHGDGKYDKGNNVFAGWASASSVPASDVFLYTEVGGHAPDMDECNYICSEQGHTDIVNALVATVNEYLK